jgi:ActR/RegA family two-component response regulator
MSNVSTRPALLLVEDDLHVARSLARTLGALGYDVVHLANAPVATALLQDRAFDVVLSDLRLGAGSGLAVLAAARAAQPSARLVLMSGSPTPASARAAAELGVAAYLAKPMLRSELEAALGAPERARRRNAGVLRLPGENVQSAASA